MLKSIKDRAPIEQAGTATLYLSGVVPGIEIQKGLKGRVVSHPCNRDTVLIVDLNSIIDIIALNAWVDENQDSVFKCGIQYHYL